MIVRDFTTVLNEDGKNVFLLLDLRKATLTTESTEKVAFLSQNPNRVINFFSKSVWVESSLEGLRVLAIYANPLMSEGAKSFQVALVGIHDEIWSALNDGYSLGVIPIGYDERIFNSQERIDAIEIVDYREIAV